MVEENKVYIIAEIGINHSGNVNHAKKMIDEAKRAGADAVKFQTYQTEKRVPQDSPIFDILKKCELSHEQTKDLHNYSINKGIDFFSTPFDAESLDLLVSLNVPYIKIASFDITNKPLLERVAQTGIPTIISRGMSNTDEIDSAANIFNEHNAPYTLLHCVSSYPTRAEDANLNIISSLKQKYGPNIGYSDHTLGYHAPVLAVAMGAKVIEKHFMLSGDDDAVDKAVSADEIMFRKMVSEIRLAEKYLGSASIVMQDCEKDILPYRRFDNV